MRSIPSFASVLTVFCLAVSPSFAATPATPKSGHSQIVIVFKDGHRQSYNLAEIERIEFPNAPLTAGEASAANPSLPSRAHFVGKWEVGDGMGSTFTITLEDNGDAWKSLNHVRGHWVYVDGEARVTWEDTWTDVIRKVGTYYQKFAYKAGHSVTDAPDNLDSARLITPRPI